MRQSNIDMFQDTMSILQRGSYQLGARRVLGEKQNKNWRAKLGYQKAYETLRAAFGENDPDTRDIWRRIVRMKGGR